VIIPVLNSCLKGMLGALVELKSPHVPRVPEVTVTEAHLVYYFEVVSTDCFVGLPLFAAFFST
jgi:hypothetical protein